MRYAPACKIRLAAWWDWLGGGGMRCAPACKIRLAAWWAWLGKRRGGGEGGDSPVKRPWTAPTGPDGQQPVLTAVGSPFTG